MARQYKRFFPKNSKYERKTSTKHGKEVVQYIERKDFDEMIRLCLIKRDKNINSPKTYFRWYRNYIFLLLGVNTGCRTETQTELIGRDLIGGKIVITEHKTGKRQQYELNKDVYKIIKEYLDYYNFTNEPNKFIFPKDLNSLDAITRQSTYTWINKLAKEAKIKYPVGAYSLRKSYARWIYDETGDILLIQNLLNHTSPEITMRYIGLEANKIEEYRELISHLSQYQ